LGAVAGNFEAAAGHQRSREQQSFARADAYA